MPINDWMPTLVANMEAIPDIQAHQYDNLPGSLVGALPCMIILPVGGDQ